MAIPCRAFTLPTSEKRYKINNKLIYKATNTRNNKVYIGQTNDLRRRIREHKGHAVKDGGAFHDDIQKYGIEAFKFEVLIECDANDADAWERTYISSARKKYGNDNVYNYCDGGLGGQTHDVRGSKNPQYGKHKTQEEKDNLSRKLSGKKKPEGFGDKVSKALKGKPKSKEAVLKKSHGISVINQFTGEIIKFDSKASMERTLHCSTSTIINGGKTKTGYKLYKLHK